MTAEEWSEALEVVVVLAEASEMRGDADGKRVAADVREVLAKEVGCSLGVAGGGGADDLDVVAFPGHLMATGRFARRSDHGVEVGDGKPEGRVGVDREAQRRCRLVCIDGPLRLAVERRRPPVCGKHTAVVLDRRPSLGRSIMVPLGLIGRWLHDCKVAWMA